VPPEPRGEEGSVAPRYRRAFGCFMWVNMGMLVFLAVAFLLPQPLRFFAEGAVPLEILTRLTLYGLVLFLPGMALGSLLGARTYRAPRRVAARAGAGVGAAISWSGFFALDYLGSLTSPNWQSLFSYGWLNALLSYVFGLLLLVDAVFVLYALFATRASEARRQRAGVAGGAFVGIMGIVVLAAGFSPVGLAGAVVALFSGAAGGWVGGAGYSRTGGEEMLPPNASRK